MAVTLVAQLPVRLAASPVEAAELLALAGGQLLPPPRLFGWHALHLHL